MIPSEALYYAQLPADPATRWQAIPQALENLKIKAKTLGLWNLWLSGGDFQGMAGGEGGGLTNLEVRLLLTYQPKLLICRIYWWIADEYGADSMP